MLYVIEEDLMYYGWNPNYSHRNYFTNAAGYEVWP